MTSLSEVDIDTIIERLTPARVRVFQVVQVALVLGIMVMLVMILFLFGLGRETVPGELRDDLMRSLTLMLAAVTVVALVVGEYVYRRLLSPGRFRAYATRPVRDRSRVIDDPAEKILTLMQQAMLVRLSIYNAPAFFGLVVCLVELVSGVIFAYPQYMVVTIPAFVQLAFLAVTFPTRERLIHVAREKVLQGRG